MNKQNDGADDNGRSDRFAIIDRLYQVALEPEEYETLLDLWEEKIAPFRSAFGSDKFVENASGLRTWDHFGMTVCKR